MRFKGSLALVLTISLLAMSSLASACDLSCSFQRILPACQSATAQTQDQQNEVMPGMDMSHQSHQDVAEAQSNSQAGTVFLNDVSCSHEKCSQSSVSVSTVGTYHGQVKSTHAVAVSLIQIPAKLLRNSYTNSETSPHELPAISPLSIYLRI